MDNKEPKDGAYNNDATDKFYGQENAEQSQFSSSTDASLNAASKRGYKTNKRGLGKFWLVSVAIVVIAVVSAIIATFTGPQKNPASQTSSTQVSNKTVSIGLKLAPTNL
ncbi:ABC transporter substrate-binding protein, partial [Gardnerella vaginalis]